MRKLLILFSTFIVLLLAACGGGETDNGEETETNPEGQEEQAGQVEEAEITVGASSIPHAEILEEAQPLLEEEGITLHIEEYQDYVLPNDDLAGESLDANFFQHIPFLEQTIADTGYEIESIGGVHIEPMGVYSQNIESVEDIEEGTEVILSNSVPEHARILALFENEGLITLNEDVKSSEATLDDIEDNPLDLTFAPDFDPAFLPEVYHSEENALVVINTNYAIQADLNPLEDALFIEGEESDFVNVVAVRSEDADSQALQKLIEVLQSEEIQDFILENYDGAVVPASGNE